MAGTRPRWIYPCCGRCSGRKGKLILVTAITPTPAGEGKTTTSVGLADGLHRLGKALCVAPCGSPRWARCSA